jgi:serine/threonine-protein kinase HipA
MTTPKGMVADAFAWIWLPEATEPVVAGHLRKDGDLVLFTYDESYRHSKEAIPIYEPELPLREGAINPINGLAMASCIRDGSVDAWGRQVVLNKLTVTKPYAFDAPEISELAFLLQSGSDRIGALDFQTSATEYTPRIAARASLDEIIAAGKLVQDGRPLPPALREVIDYGAAVGGARPKVLFENCEKKFIAKFSTARDHYNIIKAEFISMSLARACGLNVASVAITRAAHEHVLLIERFDRHQTKNGWARRAMVSALTILGLDEMAARYCSYEDLADIIKQRFSAPESTLRELFGRICFNILCGNTDDHARNHSAFWDGRMLTLTPAYDICPQSRSGNEATQAMLIRESNRTSKLSTLLAAAHVYGIEDTEAVSLIEHQLTTIAEYWPEVCAQAELNGSEKTLLSTRQFLNDYSIDQIDGHLRDSFMTAQHALVAT